MSTDTSEHSLVAAPDAPPPAPAPRRRRRSKLTALGGVVSVVLLAAVIYWASKQQAPKLPHTPAEIAALIGAVALYALATMVRAERWQRLLADEGSRPPRADTYSLTVIGYTGNNILPARAGDAVRVMLMAPPGKTSKRTVVGTLLAERLLDIAVLVVLFVIVGWGLLGKVGGGSVELIGLAAIVLGSGAAVGWRFIRRNERLHGMIAPIASATLGMRRAHHGLSLLAMTLLIWAIEAAVWMSVGAAVGFGMDPIEGLYLVALASVFSLIPSGPAYAGTQDSAVAVGIKALGGTGGTAVGYMLMLRFVVVVPITVVGLILLAVRYGGLKRLRAARDEEEQGGVTGVATPAAARPEAEPRRRRSPRDWFADQDKRELALWAGLIALAVLVRFIGLANRPFHHDESQDAYFSWLFRKTGDYQYNPLLHGPFRFYLTALMYVLFGDTDFTARLAPALMGITMVALPFGLRRQLGRGGAFGAAALLAFEPTYLYFSRFAREDIYIACLTLALIVVIFRFLSEPRKHHPALIGALLAASFATKESTFITVFVMGTFFLAALAYKPTRMEVWGPVRGVGLEAWGWALASFALLFTLLFTTFLTNPSGLWDGIYTGLKYWLGQQHVGRGGEPKEFYGVILVAQEWPALLFGAIGAVSLLKRRRLIGYFLLWDFLLSLAVYSWASEKFAWLVMHPLLPLLLLSGAGLQAIWQARGVMRYVGIVAAAVAVVYLAGSSWRINFGGHGADPTELLVSTQSSTQVKDVAEQVLALAKSRGPDQPPLTVTVDAAEGATFPYAWYFRHLATGYIDESLANSPPPTSDVVLLTEGSRTRLGKAMDAYRQRKYDFRVWWVRDYGKLTHPSAWLNWMLHRKVWNPTGGMPEYLYIKK